MGGCFSKKTRDITSPQSELKTLDQETVKNESKSHDLDRFSSEDEKGIRTEQKPIVLPLPLGKNPTKSDPIDAPGNNIAVGLGVLRISSCTKEEIDAILIQCGRLSRSSSNGKTAACSGSSENQATGHTRRHSGSKRSYDFDQDGSMNPKGSTFQRDDDVADDDDDDDDQTTVERIRRHRQQRQSSGRRRRTPSRERDQQQRSKSNSSGTARRVSRSPNRGRSESPITGGGRGAIAVLGNNITNKPGKIVTVPATVTSLVMEKSNNLCKTQLKEISVVVSRSAASPRSQSPARANFRAAPENPNPQPLSLSRSNSRKAEQSPFRRNPLGEIDQNITSTTVCQKTIVNNVKNNNPSSYTALLLEDIQNFHQKKELPEVIVKDAGLLEQSIHHQYVTVRRGKKEEGEESSGSNSIVSSGHNWVSADSTDTCSSKDDDIRTRRTSEKKKSGFEINKQQAAAARIGRK